VFDHHNRLVHKERFSENQDQGYEAKLSSLHQLDAIFSIFGASDRDKRLILQSRGLLKRL
jgi:hypothetical protein